MARYLSKVCSFIITSGSLAVQYTAYIQVRITVYWRLQPRWTSTRDCSLDFSKLSLQKSIHIHFTISIISLNSKTRPGLRYSTDTTLQNKVKYQFHSNYTVVTREAISRLYWWELLLSVERSRKSSNLSQHDPTYQADSNI